MKCARKGCRNRLPSREGLPGRPRATCSDACRAARYRVRRRKQAAIWSTGEVQWYTPPELLAELAAEFGPFDLDPCADERSPCWSLVPHHYTVDDDGLALDWFGRVFMNPPYGRAIVAWMAKAAEEVQAGRARVVVCLVPSRTDTQWWHDAMAHEPTVKQLKGRVRFIRPDGSRAGGAGFPSAVIVFRDARTVTKRASRSSGVRRAA